MGLYLYFKERKSISQILRQSTGYASLYFDSGVVSELISVRMFLHMFMNAHHIIFVCINFEERTLNF